MIANITSGAEINGVIMYNENKITRGEGELISSNHVDVFNLTSKKESFSEHHLSNKNTKNVVFHASLNLPHGVILSNDKFNKIAKMYMNQMGYKDQPYLVYKHNDKEHSHIHIVSSRVNKEGKKIKDSLERVRSQKALDKIIELYQLPKVERKKKRIKSEEIRKAGTKNDMYNIIKHIQNKYKPTNLTEYNQFLKKYDMRVQHKKGQTTSGKNYEGLIYINSTVVKGEEQKSNQVMQEEIGIKSSNFNNIQTLKELQKTFEKNDIRKKKCLIIIRRSLFGLAEFDKKLSLKEFNKFLKDHHIEPIYSKNKNGINGISFIDQNTKHYYKASEVSKELSFNKLKARVNFEKLTHNDTHKEHDAGIDKLNDEIDKDMIEAFKEVEKLNEEIVARRIINDFKEIEKKSQVPKNVEEQDVPKLSKKRKRGRTL